jgi:hypothetical protein
MPFRATVRTLQATTTHYMLAAHSMDVLVAMAERYAGCAYACTVKPLRQGGAV